MERGEYANARKIARDTDDKAEAEALLAIVNFQEAASAIEKGEVPRAFELSENENDPVRRALLHAGLAALLQKNGDGNAAVQSLLRAQREAFQVEARLRGPLLLAISGPAVGVDPTTGLSALRQAVDAFNEVSNLAARPDQSVTGPIIRGRVSQNSFFEASRGFWNILRVGRGQVGFQLTVKGVNDFDFLPSLLRKFPAADDQVETIVGALRDESRCAAALASPAPAYLERLAGSGLPPVQSKPPSPRSP